MRRVHRRPRARVLLLVLQVWQPGDGADALHQLVVSREEEASTAVSIELARAAARRSRSRTLPTAAPLPSSRTVSGFV